MKTTLLLVRSYSFRYILEAAITSFYYVHVIINKPCSIAVCSFCPRATMFCFFPEVNCHPTLILLAWAILKVRVFISGQCIGAQYLKCAKWFAPSGQTLGGGGSKTYCPGCCFYVPANRREWCAGSYKLSISSSTQNKNT